MGTVLHVIIDTFYYHTYIIIQCFTVLVNVS